MKIRISAVVIIFAMASALLLAKDAEKEKAASPSPKPAKEKAASGKPAAFDLKNPTELVTTEIYADETFFDSAHNIGKFFGHVKVRDPRFALQSDKLTAYISKANQGLEKAVATGNVGVVRDRPDPNGGPPQRSIGLADTGVYTTNDGIVQLTGNPRVQQGMNMHIASSPDTVMILNQEGQLTTRGPSRTEIRQQPSPSPSGSPSGSPSASPSATPKK